MPQPTTPQDVKNVESSQEPQTPPVQKVKIGEDEYEMSALTDLVTKAKKVSEYEKSWNTPIDSLASAYGKSQSELTKLRAENSEAVKKLQEYEAKKEEGTETTADTAQARAAAKKLGIVLDDDIKNMTSKYISVDDLPKYLEDYESQKEMTKKIQNQVKELEEKYNGKDGKPRFNKLAVLHYAKGEGIFDIEEAFNKLYKDEIESYQSNAINKAKPDNVSILGSTQGQKEPQRVKITDANLNDFLKEASNKRES